MHQKGKLIYGIQQIGVGVDDASKAFEWYGTRLGADVRVFEDNNVATYMAKYMGGSAHHKRAILAMNLRGGSGYELWQYLDRTPTSPMQPIQLGDLGITVGFVKTTDVNKSYERLQHVGENILSPIVHEPDGEAAFYLLDPWKNILKIKTSNSWFGHSGPELGGLSGCQIGVSDIPKALRLYADVLGYNQVIYDKQDQFEDLRYLPGGEGTFRRILLGHKPDRNGGFSKLLGTSQLELIQRLDAPAGKKIFAGRYWGDIGFIHLCFDIRHMQVLVQECAAQGFPFQVLSGESFNMGDANGHWGYLEDQDGTLIEFVETHKVPLIKKLGLNIKLKNRDPHKPLPNWLIKAMAFKRVKFSSNGK